LNWHAVGRCVTDACASTALLAVLGCERAAGATRPRDCAVAGHASGHERARLRRCLVCRSPRPRDCAVAGHASGHERARLRPCLVCRSPRPHNRTRARTRAALSCLQEPAASRPRSCWTRVGNRRCRTRVVSRRGEICVSTGFLFCDFSVYCRRPLTTTRICVFLCEHAFGNETEFLRFQCLLQTTTDDHEDLCVSM
jgi:hypothetical protein